MWRGQGVEDVRGGLGGEAGAQCAGVVQPLGEGAPELPGGVGAGVCELMVTSFDPEALVLHAVVTVTVKCTVPLAPAVNWMAEVEPPEVIVPPEADHA